MGWQSAEGWAVVLKVLFQIASQMIIDNRLLLLKLVVLWDPIPLPVFCWLRSPFAPSLMSISFNFVVITCFIPMLRFYLQYHALLGFYCALTVAVCLQYCTWQKQYVWRYCESWSKTPESLQSYFVGFLYKLEGSVLMQPQHPKNKCVRSYRQCRVQTL